MQPKRVTFISSSLGSGGAERVLSIIANELARRGVLVSVVITSTHKTDPFYGLDPSIDFRAPFAGRRYRNKVAALLGSFRLLSDLRESVLATRPEVVVAFIEKTAALALAALGRSGIPVVACEHIYPPAQPLGLFWESLRRLNYPKAAAVTVLTEEAVRCFPYVGKDRIFVLPNPVLPPPIPSRSSRGKTIVSAGRFTDQKGFDILLKAFDDAAGDRPDWRLVVWGDGPLRPDLEKLRAGLKSADRILLPGVTKAIYDEFASSSIYALSSRFEGFPMTLCEAMAVGTPAVAVDCMTGPRHIVRDGIDGTLVPQGDPNALSEALGDLMDDEELRIAYGSRASEITERYSLEAIMRIWEAIFEKVLP